MSKANRGDNLGPVVKSHKGYNIRHMIIFKSERNKPGIKQHTGKFGIYAGRKKFIREEKNLEEAMKTIDGLVLKSIKRNQQKLERSQSQK